MVSCASERSSRSRPLVLDSADDDPGSPLTASPQTRPSSPSTAAAQAAEEGQAAADGRSIAEPSRAAGGGGLVAGDMAGGRAEEAEKGRPGRWRASLCGIALALTCLMSCFMEASLYRKFTPVYTETECGNQTASLDRMSLGVDEIEIGLTIEVTCRNPNPYALRIVASTPGVVFVKVGDEHITLGDLDLVPGKGLPEYGAGVLSVRMDTKLTGSQAEQLLPHFLTDQTVPILMELRFNIGVAISFGVTHWSVTEPFRKACGLRMSGMLVNQFLPADNSERSNRLGPLICRDSFIGLSQELPPVGEKSETPEDGNMGFSAAQVAPGEVAAGEMLKTVGLGVSFVMSLFWFIIFSLGSSATFAHHSGFKGLMGDLWASHNGFYSRVLVGHAWNGAVIVLEGIVGPCGFSAPPGWFVPAEQLIPPPRPIVCQPEVLPASGAPLCRADCWRSFFGGAAEGNASDPLRPRDIVACKKGAVGYQRLASVAPDTASPVKMTEADFPQHAKSARDLVTTEAPSVEDLPVRSTTAPVLNAVTARRAGLWEASPFDDQRPISPPPPFQPRSRSACPPLPSTDEASAVNRYDDPSPMIMPSPSAFSMDVAISESAPKMDEVPSERRSSDAWVQLGSHETSTRPLPLPPPRRR
mmetsp:Transcript_39471/g.113470  ORF Transcript_39471/g.113470 Transcript_39471/m.113470 type:complete len:642 (+) Transcript_39471:80-2005(+)